MTHFKIHINSRKNLERDEPLNDPLDDPLKVDKLEKYDKCIKKLRENLKKICKNRAIKKVKTIQDSGVLFCKPSTTLKKFRRPVKIVELREWQKKSKNLKTIKNFKLQALFLKIPYNCKIRKLETILLPLETM